MPGYSDPVLSHASVGAYFLFVSVDALAAVVGRTVTSLVVRTIVAIGP